ncbi:MAG TPA: DNA-directed RNA polymerase subunit H [Candidatus Diapherotrites archaeon]|uniref:DNA-directed RNA polymerase subunit Rpo5 n=1 Tax=Candidatus Iainarchaeum sp. TaxID=3101447 RepID=A0A7J4KSA2_9ARCH|nr:DNA-directed RNA polymerase subunit H [Candidatus Diapherotrites archaeon]
MVSLLGVKNLQENYLVPKHEIVPKERAQEILAKYGADAKKLPHLLREDPVVEEIGAKKGDLVRIVRESQTAGKAIYYRIVV